MVKRIGYYFCRPVWAATLVFSCIALIAIQIFLLDRRQSEASLSFVAQALPQKTAIEPEALLSFHWFGLSAQAIESLPPAAWPLVLEGVLLSTDIRHSSVIISEQGKPGVLYFMGDRLPQGGVIQQITNKAVVINHNGVLERLSLLPR